ncbi:MAG: bifunctional 5,10-methylenetetrahydrofolate dehydrogenase/5,10-methenyltetrahydrofolate cyclohydrolase [Patescibacteria group bacterium]
MILYGAPVREKIKQELIERVRRLKKKPVLAIVQVGDREDSNVYIKQKQKFGGEIEIEILLNKFEKNISEKDLILEIKKLNKDKKVGGIIVQLPLPKNFDTEKIINSVSVKKDADGLVSRATLEDCPKRVALDTIPATARGVMALLDYYEIEIKGKKAAVIGQSILAGKPIANELEKRGAEVFRCDINTENIPKIAGECDILISAVGKAGLITKEFVNKEQVIIDVGINRTKEGKLTGDVDFEEIKRIVAAITPVPGGVGPLTVACLFQNLLDLCEQKVL